MGGKMVHCIGDTNKYFRTKRNYTAGNPAPRMGKRIRNGTKKTGNLHSISAQHQSGETKQTLGNTARRTLGPTRSGRAPAPAPARVATREGLGEAPLVLATAEKEDLMDRDARRDSIKRGKRWGYAEADGGSPGLRGTL